MESSDTHARQLGRRSLVAAAVGVFVVASLIVRPSRAQESPFDVEAYSAFLAEHTSLDAAGLTSMHPAGLFRQSAGNRFVESLYADSLDLIYQFTDYEKSLLDRHGFMVTERISPESFAAAFVEIYDYDLPVFVSADALLHALHMSYDLILRETEESVIIARLRQLLSDMHAAVPQMASDYASVPAMTQSLRDVDAYLAVARSLLEGNRTATVFAESGQTVDEILDFVAAEDAVQYKLFAETCRWLDFSQFTPRGHYTLSEQLTRYFQSMIWLGRTELYLIGPNTAECKPTDADVQRQTVDAALLIELLDRTGARAILDDIDRLISFFVGEQDNVTPDNLTQVLTEESLTAATLLDESTWRAFQDVVRTKPFAEQRINSQILFSANITDPDAIVPASSFMLMGQRFVIDSYVTGHVVFDEVPARPPQYPIPRILPSTLDVLFALGNDATAQFLEAELDRYGYARYLAALRYLIDSYGEAFWSSTIYNGWLDAIRALRPPAERSHLPAFMQTAAWWQQKMNSQLAAWAQLRHDNLLYAKQSYTGGIVCEYPYSLVEPIPEFFQRMKVLSQRASSRFAEFELNGWDTSRIVDHFAYFAAVSDTLEGIARKQLIGQELDDAQTAFLQHMVRTRFTCGPEIDGWYPRLFFGGVNQSLKPDMVVADIHTAPTNEFGVMVGYVVHAGTGPLNMAVVTTTVPGVGPVSFVGPVMSYFEHVSTGFKRLTDEAWQTAYSAEPSFRPNFVNLYLADASGSSRGNAPSLAVGVEPDPTLPEITEHLQLTQNYPNPFRESTVVGFSIPPSLNLQTVQVSVYDLHGRLVRRLVEERLPSGNYTATWDGRLSDGSRVASGVYFCTVSVGGHRRTVPMTVIR